MRALLAVGAFGLLATATAGVQTWRIGELKKDIVTLEGALKEANGRIVAYQEEAERETVRAGATEVRCIATAPVSWKQGFQDGLRACIANNPDSRAPDPALDCSVSLRPDPTPAVNAVPGNPPG